LQSDGQPVSEVFRICPACGAEIEQKAGPFICEKCNYANFFGPVLAVGALIENESGELLLVRRAREPGKGKWGLPGGFVDAGESAEQATAREVHEEVGITIEEFDYMFSGPNLYNYRGIVSPVVDLFFLCRLSAEVQIRLAVDELSEFIWTVPKPEHLDNMAFPSNRRALEFWLEHHSGSGR